MKRRLIILLLVLNVTLTALDHYTTYRNLGTGAAYEVNPTRHLIENETWELFSLSYLVVLGCLASLGLQKGGKMFYLVLILLVVLGVVRGLYVLQNELVYKKIKKF